mmetsp:Transcript_50903/g.103478  ORF Transcript_50903/g.103478 Transcript_50903/m.103478 type:complete len:300 (-) Transcript_50903:997-1896(-)
MGGKPRLLHDLRLDRLGCRLDSFMVDTVVHLRSRVEHRRVMHAARLPLLHQLLRELGCRCLHCRAVDPCVHVLLAVEQLGVSTLRFVDQLLLQVLRRCFHCVPVHTIVHLLLAVKDVCALRLRGSLLMVLFRMMRLLMMLLMMVRRVHGPTSREGERVLASRQFDLVHRDPARDRDGEMRRALIKVCSSSRRVRCMVVVVVGVGHGIDAALHARDLLRLFLDPLRKRRHRRRHRLPNLIVLLVRSGLAGLVLNPINPSIPCAFDVMLPTFDVVILCMSLLLLGRVHMPREMDLVDLIPL